MRSLRWMRGAFALSLALAASPAGAAPFSDLVVLSGSLSDTGNYASVEGDLPPPFFQNRSTNGPSVIDVLAEQLLLSSKPSLHLVGKNEGSNYAVLGALAGGKGPRDLAAQVDAYLGARSRKADPDALFFIFIGGNDVVDAAVAPDPKQARRILVDAVDGIEKAVKDLVRAGAENVLIGNFIDLGLAPAARDAGIASIGTERTVEFNELLKKRMTRLQLRLGRHLMTYDFFRFGEDHIAAAEELGFTNIADSCLAQPSGGCDFDRFIFFNELFPTARVHRLLGNQIASEVAKQLARPLCAPFATLHCDPYLRH